MRLGFRVIALGAACLSQVSFAMDGLCDWSEQRKIRVLTEVENHLIGDSRLEGWSFTLPMDTEMHTFMRYGDYCIIVARPDDMGPVLLGIIYDHETGEFLRFEINHIKDM